MLPCVVDFESRLSFCLEIAVLLRLGVYFLMITKQTWVDVYTLKSISTHQVNCALNIMSTQMFEHTVGN